MCCDELNLLAKRTLSEYPINGKFPVTGKYNFPQLAQINYLPVGIVYPFNHIKSLSKIGSYWYHCFTAEKNFNRLYTCFNDYVELLRKAKGIISADFSLFRNYPEELLIANCRANRMVDYALQQAGIPMIPTAGFAGESSWEWCFDGLPLNSTVAVTTNTVRGLEANRLFVGGINAMVKKINPTAIVVCGKCPDWMQKKFPDINIVQIPNYSQMWQERMKCNGRLRGRKRQSEKDKRWLFF